MIKKSLISAILLEALATSVSAFYVNENNIIDGHFGVGGFYTQNNGDNAKLSHYGGYLSLGFVDMYLGRIQIGGDFKVGYGHNQVNFNDFSNSNMIYFSGLSKIGFNMLGVNAPLFFNIYDADSFISPKDKGALLSINAIGADLDVSLSIVGDTKLAYGGGRSWIISAIYWFGNNKAYIDGYNSVIHATLDFRTKISQNLEPYVKSIVKHYDLDASKQVNVNNIQINYPSFKAWNANAEVGIVF